MSLGRPFFLAPNGTPRSKSAYGVRFLFTGREYLAPLGLYDYRHRAYSPTLGRFLQVDPAGFPWSSLYTGMSNTSILFVDPLGLQDQLAPPFWPRGLDLTEAWPEPFIAPPTGRMTWADAVVHYQTGRGVTVLVDPDELDFSGLKRFQKRYRFREVIDSVPNEDFLVFGTVELEWDEEGKSFTLVNEWFDFDIKGESLVRDLETLVAHFLVDPSGRTGRPFQIRFLRPKIWLEK